MGVRSFAILVSVGFVVIAGSAHALDGHRDLSGRRFGSGARGSDHGRPIHVGTHNVFGLGVGGGAEGAPGVPRDQALRLSQHATDLAKHYWSVQRSRPDVLCLQECGPELAGTVAQRMTERAAAAGLWTSYAAVPLHDQYLAVVHSSDWHVAWQKAIELPPPRRDRFFTHWFGIGDSVVPHWAKAFQVALERTFDGQMLHVVVLHFDHTSREIYGRAAMQRLAQHLAESGVLDDPMARVVVAGDTNFARLGYTLFDRREAQRQLHDEMAAPLQTIGLRDTNDQPTHHFHRMLSGPARPIGLAADWLRARGLDLKQRLDVLLADVDPLEVGNVPVASSDHNLVYVRLPVGDGRRPPLELAPSALTLTSPGRSPSSLPAWASAR